MVRSHDTEPTVLSDQRVCLPFRCSGDVDGSPLSELPPAGLLRHPGLGEAEDHGGELRLQRDPEGEAAQLFSCSPAVVVR